MQSLESHVGSNAPESASDEVIVPQAANILEVDEASNCLLVSSAIPGVPLPNVKFTWRDGIPQILACLACASIVIQAGVNMSYSAVLLPQLLALDSNVQISMDQGSWIASLVTISTPFGSILSGSLMDKMGRKAVCKLTSIPLILSWIIVAFVNNVHALYFARVLAGFGSGLSTAALMYISEVSHPNFRPMLLCLNSVFTSFGILLTCFFGLWMGYQSMAMTFAVLSLLSYMVTWPLPESPYWLASVKSMARAENALRWLNRRESCYQNELQRLVENSKNISTPEKIDGLNQCKTNFTKPSIYKPLVILTFIFIFQQFSGAYVVIFYAVNLFQTIGGKLGSGVDENSALFILGLIRFMMSAVVAIASRKFGRRHLFILSGLGMAISALIAALYMNTHGISECDFFSSKYQSSNHSNVIVNSTIFGEHKDVSINNGSFLNDSFLTENENTQPHSMNTSLENLQHTLNNSGSIIDKVDETKYLRNIHANITNSTQNDSEFTDEHWIPLVCTLSFVSFSAIGFLVIPWTLSGELLPIKVRGTCTGFMIAFAYILMFIIVKIFPFALSVMKVDRIFFFFSSMSFMGALFVYVFLPETLGRSFQEIEDHFE